VPVRGLWHENVSLVASDDTAGSRRPASVPSTGVRCGLLRRDHADWPTRDLKCASTGVCSDHRSLHRIAVVLTRASKPAEPLLDVSARSVRLRVLVRPDDERA
jgi:hypothetical protein